jgi:hypothetical protein
MEATLTKTRPAGAPPAATPHLFVVERDQVYRFRNVVLWEVANVEWLGLDAKVTLRPVEGVPRTTEIQASKLCGDSDWERLPDEEGETAIWGGHTKVGMGPR